MFVVNDESMFTGCLRKLTYISFMYDTLNSTRHLHFRVSCDEEVSAL